MKVPALRGSRLESSSAAEIRAWKFQCCRDPDMIVPVLQGSGHESSSAAGIRTWKLQCCGDPDMKAPVRRGFGHESSSVAGIPIWKFQCCRDPDREQIFMLTLCITIKIPESHFLSPTMGGHYVSSQMSEVAESLKGSIVPKRFVSIFGIKLTLCRVGPVLLPTTAYKLVKEVVNLYRSVTV